MAWFIIWTGRQRLLKRCGAGAGAALGQARCRGWRDAGAGAAGAGVAGAGVAGAGAYSLHFAQKGCEADALELADRINAMTESGCAQYLRCHFHSCEKTEMLGRSNHPLFVGKRDSETNARPPLSGRHVRAANGC